MVGQVHVSHVVSWAPSDFYSRECNKYCILKLFLDIMQHSRPLGSSGLVLFSTTPRWLTCISVGMCFLNALGMMTLCSLISSRVRCLDISLPCDVARKLCTMTSISSLHILLFFVLC